MPPMQPTEPSGGPRTRPNLAFSLLSQGGFHPRIPAPTAVEGIGMEMAARIFSRMNTDLLVLTPAPASPCRTRRHRRVLAWSA